MVGSVFVAVGGRNSSHRSDGLSAEIWKLLNIEDSFSLIWKVEQKYRNTIMKKLEIMLCCLGASWWLNKTQKEMCMESAVFCQYFNTDILLYSILFRLYCIILYYINSIYWLHCFCRHGGLLLALIQTNHLTKGKVNNNHCLHNTFAWSYGPSILMMPVENAISYFAPEYPINAQMASSVVIKKALTHG